MSLQIWLPFNGDLYNQGLLNSPNKVILQSGNSFATNGKIGKCLSSTTTNITYFQDTSNNKLISLFASGHIYSMAFWYKLTGNGTNGSIVQMGTSTPSSGSGNGVFGFWWTKDNGGTNPRLVWNDGDNGKRILTKANDNSDIALDYTNWHHLVAIIDKTNMAAQRQIFYIDGVKIRDQVYDNSNANTLLTTNENNFIYFRPYYALLNDFRIYDHALSEKEVKKISQGLILHYQLNHITQLPSQFQELEYLESTGTQYLSTGLVPQTTYTYKFKYAITTISQYRGPFIAYNAEANNTVRIIPDNGSTTNVLIYFNSKASGGPITLNNLTTGENEIIEGTLSKTSYWLRNLTTNKEFSDYNATDLFPIKGSALTAQMMLFGRNGYTTSCKIYYFDTWDGDNLIQHLVPAKRLSDNVLGMYDTINQQFITNAGTGTFIAKEKNIDLIIHDSSGYNNNGNVMNTLNIIYENLKYNTALSFNGNNNGILIENLELSNILNNQVTISFWIKPQGENGARSVYFGSYSGTSWSIEKTTGNVLRSYWNGSPDTTCTGASITDGIWQHICVVKNGTADLKVYINGVLKFSSTTTLSAKTFPTTYRIGRDTRSGDGTPYHGSMSDFRIYVTALSADDVLELYKTSKILNNATMVARDLE